MNDYVDHLHEWLEKYGTLPERDKEKDVLKLTAKIAERAVWIRHNGSAYLQRCEQEGVDCGDTYHNERLAIERPGWCYWTDCTPGCEREPWEPTTADFDLLDLARETAPDAKLREVFLKAEYDGDDMICDERRFHCAFADFLDCIIVFGYQD